MTFDEKMEALEREIVDMCSGCTDCIRCFFYEEKDNVTDEYSCAIRDHNGRIPYHNDWNMKVALGFEKPYNPVFPEEVRQSIKQHFERVE